MKVEKMKQEIYRLIDESRNNLVKASFYGDSDVANILEKLYERWNRSNRTGEPLDHATEEELRTLYAKARYYSANPGVRYMYEYMGFTRHKGRARAEKRASRIINFLRKLRIL